MCKDQMDAAQPTHTIIQATFRLDESSRLVVPTPHPTTSTTTTFTTTSLSTDASTTKPPTSDRPTTTASPTIITASLSKTSTESTETETETASTPSGSDESEDEGSDSSTLGTAEIAGLAAGLSAAVVIAILAICFARRRRKKHYPDVETSFFMTNERLKALSRRFTILPRGDNISAPLHGSPNAAPKEFPMGEFGAMENQSQFVVPKARTGKPTLRKVPSGMASPVAGLAVTAASAVPMAVGDPSTPQSSRKRPVLSLSIPETRAGTPASQQKPAPKRDESPPRILVTAPTFKPENAAKSAPKAKASKPVTSPVDEDDSPLTEFEEDDRDSPIQIWRPPSSTPQSATAMYVADKHGNWVLADERQKKRISAAELEGSSPIISRGGSDAFRAAGPSSGATEISKTGAAALRPPAEIYKRGDKRRDMQSMASSVYSSDIPAWNTSAPPLPKNPLMPRPLNARAGPPPPRQRYSPVLNPFLDDNGISPVRSMHGSTRRAQPSTSRAAAPRGPRNMRSPPGQPSPTLGMRKPAGHTPNHSRHAPPSQPKPRTPQPRAYSPEPPVPSAAPTAPVSSPAQSTPTSLLVKRVGPEKAASLSLRGSDTSRESGGSGGRGRRGQLPSTPTWNPLMTPERRGDDLYLSIR